MRSIWWLVAGVTVFTVAMVIIGISQSLPTTKESSSINSVSPIDPELVEQDDAAAKLSEPTQFVPILMYHYIRDYQNAEDPLGIQLSVAPATLDRQLGILQAAGYQTISLTDFVAGQIKPKSVILTFDDGYLDHYTEALPILQKYHATATFFIVSGFVGRDNYMTDGQVLALKEAGMEIGGHSITHLNLANANYEKAIKEISTSLISREPVFAYPSGKYSPETLDIISGLKVKAAVTTNIGVATDRSSRYELPRIRVKDKTDLLKRINEEMAIAKRQLAPSQRSKD